MKIDVIKIGNSRGIRLPKAVLDQCGIKDEVELEVRGGEVVLRSIEKRPRAGWREAFASAAAEQGGAGQLLGDFANEFDAQEWTWPEIEPEIEPKPEVKGRKARK